MILVPGAYHWGPGEFFAFQQAKYHSNPSRHLKKISGFNVVPRVRGCPGFSRFSILKIALAHDHYRKLNCVILLERLRIPDTMDV